MKLNGRTFGMTALLALAMAGEAEAVIGRPLTPMSYAGVARRTTRRAVYGTAAVGYGAAAYGAAAVGTAVAVGATYGSLPAGCAFAGGIYNCGPHVYRPVYQGTNVVYVVEQ